MPVSMEEHRRHTRYERPLTLAIYGMDKTKLDEINSIQDVSRTGMKFETVARIQAGDYFRFHLEVPGYGHTDGMARARWLVPGPSGHSYVLGAEFTKFSWGGAKALRRYLEPGGRGFWGVVFDMSLGFAVVCVAWQVIKQLQVG